jgi:hypothetical protein
MRGLPSNTGFHCMLASKPSLSNIGKLRGNGEKPQERNRQADETAQRRSARWVRTKETEGWRHSFGSDFSIEFR